MDSGNQKKKIIIVVLTVIVAIVLLAFFLLRDQIFGNSEASEARTVEYVLEAINNESALDCTIDTFGNVIQVRASDGFDPAMISGNMTGIYTSYLIRGNEIYRWGQTAVQGFIHEHDRSVVSLLITYLDRDVVKDNSEVSCRKIPSEAFDLPSNVSFEQFVPLNILGN